MKNENYLISVTDKMKENDILIIHSICRFSRNLLGGLNILNMLEEKRLKIYSVDDHIGYDNIHDRFLFRNIINLSELETDKISHRVSAGWENKKNLEMVLRKRKNNMFLDKSLEICNTKKRKRN